MNLFITNLGRQVTNESLRAIFATYGTVGATAILSNKDAENGSRSAYVHMPDDKEARRAMARMNGSIVNGQPLSVQQAPVIETPGTEPAGGASPRFQGGIRS